ncbi:MAG: M2 family metallopeptidase [Myxococcota bacterium]
MKRALLLFLALAACNRGSPTDKTPTPPAAASTMEPRQTPQSGEQPDSAVRFLADAEKRWHEQLAESDHAQWVNQTFINDDTDWLATRAAERDMALTTDLVQQAARYKDVELPQEAARKLQLLRINTVLPSPASPEQRRELATLATDMNSMYGTGKYCQQTTKGEKCRPLGELSKVLATSRDYEELLDVWTGWHEVAKPMRDKYARFVTLGNKGAESIGFKDLGELWRAKFDMTPAQLEAESERLWSQVQPFYNSLHCYVRRKLQAHYGEQRIPKHGPIPAHVLGNMWAQDWSNVYPLVEPYPGQVKLDVTKSIAAKKWTPEKMMRTGEAFFTGLGLPPLPETFWKRSLIDKPKEREVVCHASAWDLGLSGDVRIKMCTEPSEEDLVTIHHELGHIYYYLMYAKLPPLFQQGAHEGFHEGIGDTLVLSMTPAYLKSLGLLEQTPNNPKAEIDTLMKRALQRVAFLPFGKVIDQWRWQVFSGQVKPDSYNAAWWKLRTQYQGIAPASPRGEEFFDPGAKYHVPANTPYARYFFAHILQFQFHRALCRAAGHEGPLHTCSIAGNAAAGEKLATMLRMGASKPWPEALAAISGERTMDASALTEYFAPLRTYLDEANQGDQCGWQSE